MSAAGRAVIDTADAHNGIIAQARLAQRSWAETNLKSRLRMVRSLRNEIACGANSLLDAFGVSLSQRAEKFASEVIPLAAACRFLENEAEQVLAPKRLRLKATPFWLRGIQVHELREPFGVVLIIGPANYPLFLPAVQALQAMVAGNAVILKPGVGASRVIERFQRLALRAGFPETLLLVADESVGAAESLIAAGVDKIVLTGSVETGRAVYRQSADHLTPLVLELSGCDPVFILSSADVERAAKAVAFGTRWNEGNTCIAPRRIFVADRVAERFRTLLRAHAPRAVASLSIHTFSDEDEALESAAESPCALGAVVFGEISDACIVAARVRAGVVVVNDMIVPTADPRVAFGGRGQSGFGTTRGAEGLRQFTVPKAVIVQGAKRLRHLEPMPYNAEDLFGAYLAASYKTRWTDRLRGWGRLVRVLSRSRRKTL